MGAKIRVPLKPLNTIECYDIRGVSGVPWVGPPWYRETPERLEKQRLIAAVFRTVIYASQSVPEPENCFQSRPGFTANQITVCCLFYFYSMFIFIFRYEFACKFHAYIFWLLFRINLVYIWKDFLLLYLEMFSASLFRKIFCVFIWKDFLYLEIFSVLYIGETLDYNSGINFF